MQGIALATRRAKQYGINGGTWREQARARAAEHGLGAQQLARLVQRSPVSSEDPGPGLAERLSGPLGLTEMHNTFARRHALAEIAGAFAQGAAADRLEHETSNYLDHESVHALAARDRESRYTTEGLLASERQIVDGAGRRAGEHTGALATEVVERVISRRDPELNAEQAAAVRELAGSGHGVDAKTALAGSGKTTLIGALAECYQAAGWQVLGAAPTGRAARQLRDTAGIPAETIHTLLLQLGRPSRLSGRTVVVLDEAGMAPTRLTARLLAVAEQAGAKVVAIGDPGQLGSVQAGGWLAALTTKDGQPTLRQAVRQQDASEREALQALHDGDPDAYLEHKHDQITVHDYETGAVAELTQQWSNARQEHGPAAAVMIARDNYTRELANRAARTQLKREGALAPLGVFLGGREYAPGDRVIARSNHRRHDLDNGTLATVIHINPATGAMLLETDAGEPRALDPQYVAEHLQHAYALTAHSAQGATFQWAGVIGRPQEFTREWAYTALSRARRHTTIHLVAEPPEREREREEYAPPEPARDVTQALHAAMKRNESEALALANAPPEHPEPERNGLTAPHPSSSAAPTLKGVHHLRRSRQRDRPSLHL